MDPESHGSRTFLELFIQPKGLGFLYRLHTAILNRPLSSAATKKVQGPDTTWRRIQGPLLWSWRESMGKRYLVTQGRWQVFWEAPAPLHPFPPFRAAWAETHYPPPQGRPLPQENYHLGLTSVKTSFWPPNLDQKSWLGHKTTDWSRSS
jgi:hypothetical protein